MLEELVIPTYSLTVFYFLQPLPSNTKRAVLHVPNVFFINVSQDPLLYDSVNLGLLKRFFPLRETGMV